MGYILKIKSISSMKDWIRNVKERIESKLTPKCGALTSGRRGLPEEDYIFEIKMESGVCLDRLIWR